MSTAPMYGLVSPDATVETMSFGTPTGRSRIARAATDELPDPPSDSAPSTRPSPCSRRSTSAAPRPMASIAAPRSPASRSAAWSAPAALRLRVVGQLGARRLRRDAPRDHDELPVGHRGGHREILLDAEDREALRRKAAERL